MGAAYKKLTVYSNILVRYLMIAHYPIKETEQ
jgi:hypothetical protein